MERDEKALEYFSHSFNCCQSVFAGCQDISGLDEKTSLSVATGFGGGLACGEVCGALSGAVMALSAHFPNTAPDNPAGKERIHRIVEDCCTRFREEYGCVTCRELLEKAGGRERCREYVQFAAQLAGDIAEDYE